MNGELGQNVEFENYIDSTAKEETKGKKLKLHDITYEKVTDFSKNAAKMGIVSDSNDEVRDYNVDNDSEHLERISALMSNYIFLDDDNIGSPSFIARRAIRLSESMLDAAKLSSSDIIHMLDSEKDDNKDDTVSTINESDEEQLVNAINQLNENGNASDMEETDSSDLVQKIDDQIDELRAVDNVPSIETSDDTLVPVPNEVVSDSETVDISNQDFAPLFNESSLDSSADVTVEDDKTPIEANAQLDGDSTVENNSGNVVLPMTGEEIDESHENIESNIVRDDDHTFSFEDMFGPNSEIAPVDENSFDNVNKGQYSVINSDEEAFLEVNNLLQEGDDIMSRGNMANKERDKAEQRRKAAEERKQQAFDEEVMKKAALADAIKKYRTFVDNSKSQLNRTLKDIENANAAADRAQEDTRAAEERSAYTQQVIDSLLNSMENQHGRKK